MKRCFTFLLIILLVSQTFAQNKKQTKKIYYSPDPKGMQFISPGSFIRNDEGNKKTISIAGFWMSNEITNKEFNEFFQDIRQHPDSSFFWIDIKNSKETGETVKHEIPFKGIIDEIEDDLFKFKDNRTLVEHISDKKLKFYPVTGITYSMAKYFCWWKSIKENSKNKGKFLNDFRLPVEEEWEYVTYQDYNDTKPNTKLHKSKSGKKNHFHLTNLNDNVNEYISSQNSEKIIIKGSSIEKTLNCYSKILVDKDYRSTTTGFRIVRTFLGRQKNKS